MILGKGAIISSSLKEKLNVKISTEEELVGEQNGLSVVLWRKLSLRLNATRWNTAGCINMVKSVYSARDLG